METTPAAVSAVVSTRSEGLVERRRAVEDRRRHNVVITTAGRRRLSEIEKVAARRERRILGLNGDDMATLHDLLTKAVRNLNDSFGDGSHERAAIT